MRYTQDKFPEDLMFRIVGQNLENFTEGAVISKNASPRIFPSVFQGRYVIRHAKGAALCLSRLSYRRWNKRWTENLARLTGWDTKEISNKMASR